MSENNKDLNAMDCYGLSPRNDDEQGLWKGGINGVRGFLY